MATSQYNHTRLPARMTGDWMADLDPALRAQAFADARDSAIAARMDFAEAKEKYGPRVALAMFNARVDRWAREFTNQRLSRVLYVTGQAMDGSPRASGTGRVFTRRAIRDIGRRARSRSWPSSWRRSGSPVPG